MKTYDYVFANLNIFKVRIVFRLPGFLEPFEWRPPLVLEPVVVLTNANTAQLMVPSISLPVEYRKKRREIKPLLGETGMNL